jgi:hypothetical protein
LKQSLACVAPPYSNSSGARHSKYAINRTQGVQDNIIPTITASKVVTRILLRLIHNVIRSREFCGNQNFSQVKGVERRAFAKKRVPSAFILSF